MEEDLLSEVLRRGASQGKKTEKDRPLPPPPDWSSGPEGEARSAEAQGRTPGRGELVLLPPPDDAPHASGPAPASGTSHAPAPGASAAPRAIRGVRAGLKDAFSYPFRGDGLFGVAAGMLLFGLLPLVPMFPWMYLLVHVFFFLFLFAFAARVVHDSASGTSRMPEWPDASDLLGDVVQPGLVGLLSLVLPASLPALLHAAAAPAPVQVSSWVLLAAYAPMAFTLAAVTLSPAAWNPLWVFRSMLRAPRGYLVCLATLGPATALVLPYVLHLSFLPPASGRTASRALLVYVVPVCARILGNFYFANRHGLGWFRSP